MESINGVNFHDENLEYIVRAALGKPDGLLIGRDLDSLIELNFVGKEIKDISGLEGCHNLTLLNLSDNQITITAN